MFRMFLSGLTGDPIFMGLVLAVVTAERAKRPMVNLDVLLAMTADHSRRDDLYFALYRLYPVLGGHVERIGILEKAYGLSYVDAVRLYDHLGQ